ncbi:MAG: FecR domain-containing protein [Burkholderiaceae bacterium]
MVQWIRQASYCVLGCALLCAFAVLAQTPPAGQAAGASGTSATTGSPQQGAATGAASGSASSADGQGATQRNPAAKVNLVDGQVHIIGPDKVSRQSVAGEQLYEGDAIVTGDNAEIHLDMADGGFIAVRPNTQLRIAKYQANGDESDVSVIGLLKGSMRSITGWIGKTYPRKYSVVTPSATIGVRGTDHEPAYVPEGTAGVDAGTYDNVHEGSTTIGNSHGTVEVSPGKAGFVDHRGLAQPRVLDKVPAFFQVPRKHDAVFVGKSQRIAAGLEQRRVERVQQHTQELKRGGPAAAHPNASQRETRETARPGVAQNQKEKAQVNAAANKNAAPAQKAPAQQGSFLQHLLQRPQAGAPAQNAQHPAVPAKPVPKVPPKKTNNN